MVGVVGGIEGSVTCPCVRLGRGHGGSLILLLRDRAGRRRLVVGSPLVEERGRLLKRWTKLLWLDIRHVRLVDDVMWSISLSHTRTRLGRTSVITDWRLLMVGIIDCRGRGRLACDCMWWRSALAGRAGRAAKVGLVRWWCTPASPWAWATAVDGLLRWRLWRVRVVRSRWWGEGWWMGHIVWCWRSILLPVVGLRGRDPSRVTGVSHWSRSTGLQRVLRRLAMAVAVGTVVGWTRRARVETDPRNRHFKQSPLLALSLRLRRADRSRGRRERCRLAVYGAVARRCRSMTVTLGRQHGQQRRLVWF